MFKIKVVNVLLLPHSPSYNTVINLFALHEASCKWHTLLYVIPSLPHVGTEIYAQTQRDRKINKTLSWKFEFGIDLVRLRMTPGKHIRSICHRPHTCHSWDNSRTCIGHKALHKLFRSTFAFCMTRFSICKCCFSFKITEVILKQLVNKHGLSKFFILLVSYSVGATHGIEVFRAFHALAHRSIVQYEAHAAEIAAIINARVQSACGELNQLKRCFFYFYSGKYGKIPHFPTWSTVIKWLLRQDSLRRAHSFSYVCPSEPHT